MQTEHSSLQVTATSLATTATHAKWDHPVYLLPGCRGDIPAFTSPLPHQSTGTRFTDTGGMQGCVYQVG